MKLSNEVHTLIDCLLLAVLAPTGEQSQRAVDLADRLASTMSPVEVEIAKRFAEGALNDE